MVTPVKVQILDKEFLVACPEDEKDELFQSATYLSRKMQEIRDSGKVVGLDRIAVMAALNIAHELLQLQNESHSMTDVRRRLDQLNRKLEQAMDDESGNDENKSAESQAGLF